MDTPKVLKKAQSSIFDIKYKKKSRGVSNKRKETARKLCGMIIDIDSPEYHHLKEGLRGDSEAAVQLANKATAKSHTSNMKAQAKSSKIAREQDDNVKKARQRRTLGSTTKSTKKKGSTTKDDASVKPTSTPSLQKADGNSTSLTNGSKKSGSKKKIHAHHKRVHVDEERPEQLSTVEKPFIPAEEITSGMIYPNRTYVAKDF